MLSVLRLLSKIIFLCLSISLLCSVILVNVLPFLPLVDLVLVRTSGI